MTSSSASTVLPYRAGLFTSESVSPGHPDKVADQISDAVLDAILAHDPEGRVACEALIKNGLVVLAGEISTSTWVDFESIAREVIAGVGYLDPDMGFDARSCAVISAINPQSADIARGVDADDQGAGDQGLMFGYACHDTACLMPAPIMLAHRLMRRQVELRQRYPWMRPDAKAQVSLRYDDQGRPQCIDNVVVSTQHEASVSLEEVRATVVEDLIQPVMPQGWWTSDSVARVNPSGEFVIGGPVGDCGLTGRKIIVDTYGGMARHGGGAFSGKDPSKVDRSAAYMARYIAKNMVAAGLATHVEVQLSYAIGWYQPTSVAVESYGTSRLSSTELAKLVRDYFDLTPRGIITHLDLLRPIYRQTAALGHFGREDIDLPWERVDHAEALRDRVSRDKRLDRMRIQDDK